MVDDSGTYSFTWEIENFSMDVVETDESLRSSCFKAESLGGSGWYLELFRTIFSEKEFISCYLCRIDDEEVVDFEIELIGANNEILKSIKNVNVLVDEDGKGCKEFLAIEELNKKKESWKRDILTFHCLIKNHYKPKNTCHVISSVARTKIGVDRCNFDWKITFSDPSKLNNRKEIFMNRNRFLFTLTELTDEIEINIKRLDKETSISKYVSCKISLMNLKGFEVETRNVKYFMEESKKSAGHNWKLPTFLSRKTLIDRADELLAKNAFTLKFELSASSGNLVSESSVKYGASSLVNTTTLDYSFLTLHRDLRNMLKCEKYSDVKLRVESQVIPASKLFLSVRSPVFSAMFDKDMLEQQTGIVDIEDVDFETLNLFLEYIYTGNVEKLEVESTKKLLVTADKYQVTSLVEKCYVFLKAKLSVENVCDIFTLSDLINHKNLKSSALDYIETNSARVLLSKSWMDWMKVNVELANEILYELALGSSR